MDADRLEIFLACAPGLEPALHQEAAAHGFAEPQIVAGGVAAVGPWPEVWRANLTLRCAGRVLVRVGRFPAAHLAQLDKRARKLPWAAVLRREQPVRVEATCRRSRIYHAGAAAQRVATAIRETVGAETAKDAALRVLVRIENNLCEISLDASGAPLHRRGFKQAVGKAPLRETLAAAFLRQCGHDGAGTVLDPMCGSGTLAIEAAEIAAGLAPGRGRAFAFERLASFDPDAWAAMRDAAAPAREPWTCAYGFDRDAGAVAMGAENAARAGVAPWTRFARGAVGALEPPADATPGLVIVNPPYGARIGDARALRALYATLGSVLRSRFSGWRVGLITSDAGLARATELPFVETGPPAPHGPLKIRLRRTGALP